MTKQQVWFLTGSQHLYGPETLDQVAEQSAQIQGMLSASGGLSAEIVGLPVLTEAAAIRRVPAARLGADAGALSPVPGRSR